MDAGTGGQTGAGRGRMDAGTGGQTGAARIFAAMSAGSGVRERGRGCFIFVLFSVKGAGDSGEVKGNVFPFDDFLGRTCGVKFDLVGDAHALKDRRKSEERKGLF